jgi:hypothetical protein
MRFERNDAQLHATFLCEPPRFADQGLVTEMDTIEIAQRHDGTFGCDRYIVVVTKDAHCDPSALGP